MLNVLFAMTIAFTVSSCGSSDGGGGIPIIGSALSKSDSKKKARLGSGLEEEEAREREKLNKAGIAANEDYSKIVTDGWHPALVNKTAAGAPFGHLICAKGQSALKFTDYDDFSDIFGVICNKDAPHKNFNDILAKAFTGTGEPVITEYRRNINDLYVTDFIYAFAIKTPVASPAALSGYPIYENVSKGLRTPDSELQVTKVKEETFPGLGVVRAIEQDYSMPFARGAALFDRRKTLTNTYLIVENSNEVNFSAEHLLNPDTTEFYNASRQIVFGLKGETPNSTYLVYVAQLVVINRFDPERLTGAAKELAAMIPRVVLSTINAKK